MIPNKIGPFVRYTKKPSTMKYGFYYSSVFTLPFSKENKRHVRVWLPSDYDFDNPNQRYRVIYFSDGQNLVDRYLSAYGEWKFDKTVQQLMKEGLPGVIAVGIDCPKNPLQRTLELCPPHKPKSQILKIDSGALKHAYANKYVDFIANELKPLIDKLFYTIDDETAIGGSSMGGIMAFYAYIYRPDIFKFSLSFSPAFFFYKKIDWYHILDGYDINPEKNGKLFLYVGGKEFEKEFLKPTINTFNYLDKRGFDNSQLALLVDTKEIHHEGAWAKYLGEALKFWLT